MNQPSVLMMNVVIVDVKIVNLAVVKMPKPQNLIKPVLIVVVFIVNLDVAQIK